MNGCVETKNIVTPFNSKKVTEPKTNGFQLNGVDKISPHASRCQSPRNGSASPRILEKPFLIGVAGGTASGKASVCSRIMDQLGQNKVSQNDRRVVTVSMDSFYHPLSEEDEQKAQKGLYNFDHPDAFDHELLERTIKDITACRTVQLPVYDFVSYKLKTDQYQTISHADVVIFEGILLFYFPEVCSQFDMKLFVDTDADTRLSRRVMRDTEHGRNIEQILYQYTTYVKPAFEEFCLPTKKYADVIIPRGADNQIAVELIVQHIHELLQATPVYRLGAGAAPGAVGSTGHGGENSQREKALHRVASVTDATRPH